RSRAHDLGVTGVYIVLIKDVHKFRIEVGNETREHIFTDSDRDRLVKDMVQLLEHKTQEKNDEALNLAVSRITNAYIEHAKQPHGERGEKDGKGISGIGGWICIGLCVLLGIWLIVGLMRGMSGGGGGMGGGGGGFL